MDPGPEPHVGWFAKRAPRGDPGLRAEADRLRALAGPGIVPIVDLVDDGEELVLRLARAECSVADVVAERGRLSESEARAVGAATLSTLSRIHDAGLVHADVKPANLLLTDDGRLWLGDLGSARPADGSLLPTGSPGRRNRVAFATPAADIVATAVAVVEMTTMVVPDPRRAWSPTELVRIGCPPALALDVGPAFTNSPPTARRLATALAGTEQHRLPGPAERRRLVDPTPTIEFDPVVPPQPPAVADAAARLPLLAPLVLAVVVAAVVLAITVV